jgi:hypothetical protein
MEDQLMSIPSIETLLRRIRTRKMLEGIFWRYTPEARRWLAQVHANRARHPNLLAEERAGADPHSIAYEMLHRDRAATRAEYEHGIMRGEPTRRPDIWDYIIPESAHHLRVAMARRFAWESDPRRTDQFRDQADATTT